MNKKAIVIGYSGHAYVICDLLRQKGKDIIGYCEKEEKPINPYNLKYLGDENEQSVMGLLSNRLIYLGIGDNHFRAKSYQYLSSQGMNLPFLCHPKAIVSSSATVGNGTVIMPSCVINSLAEIAEGVICNTGSIIEHECKIGNFCHIAPGAVLAGNVEIGCNTFIGANSVIKQGIKIGSNVIIGAGSVVLYDIQDKEIVAGNPAKSLRK